MDSQRGPMTAMSTVLARWFSQMASAQRAPGGMDWPDQNTCPAPNRSTMARYTIAAANGASPLRKLTNTLGTAAPVSIRDSKRDQLRTDGRGAQPRVRRGV